MDVINSLLRAARAGNLKRLLEFIDDELVDINASNQNGLTALHSASKEGHANIVHELIARGANVHLKTLKGNTALHIASLAGHEQVVKLLIENGADVDVQSASGFTALYMAAQENYDSIVRLLLANGANQNLATVDGFTPLAVAMQQGHEKIASILLNSEAKGRIRFPGTTESGRSLLHIAAKKDDCAAAALLMQNHISPDLTSKSGFTALHVASHYGNVNVAKLLIEQHADVNHQAKHNITPLHVAAKWGQQGMVQLLLANHAQIDATTRDGLTPLHCAARSGHDSVVENLIRQGAPISSKTRSGLAPLHMASQGNHLASSQILLNYRAPVDDVTVDYLTALHVASHCGHVKVAKLLLNNKADPNFRALNGFTSLHIACKKNRIEVVKLLLKYGASLNAVTESGLTPLHVASFMGCVDIVIYLLDNNAHIEPVTVRGETPLHLATRANQIEVIKVLLARGAKVGARAKESQTALHIAARLGNAEIAQLLIDQGIEVDAPTKDSYTALHIASKEGHDDVVYVLLNNGADIACATRNHGFTPLHLASKYGIDRVVDTLLSYGAPVDAKGKNGVTPLHVATHYNQPNVVQLLLQPRGPSQPGALPNAMAKNGYTALHIAAKSNRLDIANNLLQHGSNPSAESNAGFCPLHLAAQEGRTDMAALLIANGANVNCRAKNGISPMHLCSQEDHVNVAQILAARGAYLDAKTNGGFTPLHVAAHFARLKMIRFLLSNGANVNVSTSSGYTPLHLASQQGNPKIVELLLQHNARPDALTETGQTPLAIAERLGCVSIIDTLRVVTETVVKTTTMTITEEKFKLVAPETMQETFPSDSEDEADDQAQPESVKFLTTDVMKKHFNQTMADDYHTSQSNLTVDPNRQQLASSRQQLMSDEMSQELTYLSREAPLDGGESTLGAPIYSQLGLSQQQASEEPENVTALDERSLSQLKPDNVDITKPLKHAGFLVSFLVDARGGAMRGCRHSGVRVIIPASFAPQPMRITCRYLRRERLVHPPPLMEGEACASRIMEVGPAGAKFLGPVVIEVPHFASLRNQEREIIILRSDNGQVWREHMSDHFDQKSVESIIRLADEKDRHEQHNDENLDPNGQQHQVESADESMLSSLSSNREKRLTRIVTDEFPQYFAIISRVRQQVHSVGPDGLTVSSENAPKVQAIFTEGALTKRIKIGLQKKDQQKDGQTQLNSPSPLDADKPINMKQTHQQTDDNDNRKQTNSSSSPSGRPTSGSSSKRRNRKLLTCFGYQHTGSQTSLGKEGTDPKNYSASSDSSAEDSGKSSPKQTVMFKDSKLRRPSQLVPENYYAETEPPLILNLEPTTYGKRLASSAVQTDERATNANKLSTCARPPKRSRCLCSRRQKSMMTIDIEDPSIETGPIVTAPEKQTQTSSKAEPTALDTNKQESSTFANELLEDVDNKLFETYLSFNGGKLRTCPIQTDSDSVTVNYVTIAQQPPSDVLDKANVEHKKDGTAAIGDDGYVSGSGGSLNKSDLKRISKEREKKERKREKEAKKRAKEDDSKADKLRRKEEKAKKKADKKKSSKSDSSDVASGQKRSESNIVSVGEPTDKDSKADSLVKEKGDNLGTNDSKRASLVAQEQLGISVELKTAEEKHADETKPAATHEPVSKQESEDKTQVLDRIATELVGEAIRASCEHLNSGADVKATDDDKPSKADDSKASDNKRQKEDKKLAKAKAKQEKKLKQEEEKRKKKEEQDKKTKLKRSKRDKSAASQSEPESSSQSQSRSFFDRLLGRAPKAQEVNKSRNEKPEVPEDLAQKSTISDSNEANKPIVISEMYPKDPNNANSEMILEVNMPKSLIENQLIEHGSQAELDQQDQLMIKVENEDKDLSSLVDDSVPTTSEHPEDTLVNVSQLPTFCEAVSADEQNRLEQTDPLSQQAETHPLDDEDPATENQIGPDEIDESVAISDNHHHQVENVTQPRDESSPVEVATKNSSKRSSKSHSDKRPSKEACAVDLAAQKETLNRKELEAKLKREADKLAKQEKQAEKKREKERIKQEKLDKKKAEIERKKAEKEEKARAKREAKEAKNKAKIDKKKNNKKDSSDASVGGSSSSKVEIKPEPQSCLTPDEEPSVKLLSEDPNYAGMVPVSEESETKKFVEEIVGDDGVVTKITKTVETKSVTLRGEEIEVKARELDAEEYERLKSLGQLDDEELGATAASSSSHQEMPPELVEICSTPSYFESISECEKLNDPSINDKKRAQLLKKEFAKRVKLNEKLIKRTLKLAKSQSKMAKRDAQQAETEIKASRESADKANKEAKRALKEAKKAEKLSQKAHKKMDKVDKKLAKKQKKIDKRQVKLDKQVAKSAEKAEKKRNELAKKEAKKEKSKLKKADQQASLDRKGSQKSKKSIKIEDIGEPTLKSSSRMSLGSSSGIALIAGGTGAAMAGAALIENEKHPRNDSQIDNYQADETAQHNTSNDDIHVEMSLDDSHIRQADQSLEELGVEEKLDEPIQLSPSPELTNEMANIVDDHPRPGDFSSGIDELRAPNDLVYEDQHQSHVQKLEAIEEEQMGQSARPDSPPCPIEEQINERRESERALESTPVAEENHFTHDPRDRVDSPASMQSKSPEPDDSMTPADQSLDPSHEETFESGTGPQFIQYQAGLPANESPVQPNLESPARSPDLLMGSDSEQAINGDDNQETTTESPVAGEPQQSQIYQEDYSSYYNQQNVHQPIAEDQDERNEDLVNFTPSPQPLDSFESSTSPHQIEPHPSIEHIEPATEPSGQSYLADLDQSDNYYPNSVTPTVDPYEAQQVHGDHKLISLDEHPEQDTESRPSQSEDLS